MLYLVEPKGKSKFISNEDKIKTVFYLYDKDSSDTVVGDTVANFYLKDVISLRMRENNLYDMLDNCLYGLMKLLYGEDANEEIFCIYTNNFSLEDFMECRDLLFQIEAIFNVHILIACYP